MKNTLEISNRTLRPNKEIVGQIVRIGLPSGITQLIMSGSFVFVQSLINTVSIPFNGIQSTAIFVAVNSAVMKIDGFAMVPSQTFNMVASTFTGQNIGAGKIDRVAKGSKIVLLISFLFACLIIGIILLFGMNLMRMFVNDPANPDRVEKILEVGLQMMRIMVWGYILMAFSQTLGGIMRGAGDTVATMWITLITTVVIRVPLTYLMIHLSKTDEYPGGQPNMVYLTMLIGFGLNTLISFIYFRTGKWKTKGVVKHPVSEFDV
jgi:Na+-driven multidrug efflux pump